VIQVEIGPKKAGIGPPDDYYLVLNGQVVVDSSVFHFALDPDYQWKWDKRAGKLLDVRVDDETAVAVLLECSLLEIAEHFAELTLLLPQPPSDDFSRVTFTCKDFKGDETCRFDFEFASDVEDWAKLWSIADVASTLKRIVENRCIPELSFQKYKDIVPEYKDTVPGISLRVELHKREETVRQALEHWLPMIQDICEEADAILASSARKGALVAHFRFAPEVKTACEQYLLYFVQFLEDLGISATADLQEQARGVLFTVTPQSGSEALERIREALDVYLGIPQNPNFDTEVARHPDIAVQQYASQVFHLRSQLALAQAVLEAKNATIEALQAANLQYKQLLNANPLTQGQLTGSSPGSTQGDEDILGGTVTITKYTGKGFQVNLPLIFRTLRRTFKREE
jgi:hypothetical protein